MIMRGAAVTMETGPLILWACADNHVALLFIRWIKVWFIYSIIHCTNVLFKVHNVYDLCGPCISMYNNYADVVKCVIWLIDHLYMVLPCIYTLAFFHTFWQFSLCIYQHALAESGELQCIVYGLKRYVLYCMHALHACTTLTVDSHQSLFRSPLGQCMQIGRNSECCISENSNS